MNTIQKEIQSQKELSVFFDILNSLPIPQKRSKKLIGEEKIPVILSADDNYSCFVATTGVSILYNTNSFIEFYVLSEGISEKNKQMIYKSYEAVTPHFSLHFIECDSAKEFSSIKLSENYHVKLNTCNRLLVPKLLPELKRAIYLDVDLIALADIKELWEEKLDGHIFGCVPPLYDYHSRIKDFCKKAFIPENSNYIYFNSGVMLIDYDRWRHVKGTNSHIINDLFDIIQRVNTEVVPDEIILNRFAYENGGYKTLAHKYNIHPYYSYLWLKKNKKIISIQDTEKLKEYESLLSTYPNEIETGLNSTPVIHHFYGKDKPWYTLCSDDFPCPCITHFNDFWFYAKMTHYFEKIKDMFVSKHMYVDHSLQEEASVMLSKLAKKYQKYKILSKITFGKRSMKYKKKKKNLEQRITSIKSILRNTK